LDFAGDRAYLPVSATALDASSMPSISTTLAKSPGRAKSQVDVEELLDNAREASAFLKALAHETRLLILCLLVDGEKSVGELERKLRLRQPFVSQQLARLRADDLVEARRDGKNIYYAIARPEVMEIIGSLYRAFCAR
jgi:DNA-binding transcriptional ArsR family regulator